MKRMIIPAVAVPASHLMAGDRNVIGDLVKFCLIPLSDHFGTLPSIAVAAGTFGILSYGVAGVLLLGSPDQHRFLIF